MIYIIYNIPYEGTELAECDTEKDATDFLINFYEILRIKSDKRKIVKIIKGKELLMELIQENITTVSKMITNVFFKEEEKETKEEYIKRNGKLNL